jgi:allantoinase
MSRNTADQVGLVAKGRLEVGADADLVVFDPIRPLDVAVAELAHRNPISAYDGRRFSGSVTHTVLAGTPIGDTTDRRGRLLERS